VKKEENEKGGNEITGSHELKRVLSSGAVIEESVINIQNKQFLPLATRILKLNL